MRKYLFFPFIFFSCLLTAKSQIPNRDSLKIQRLKKILPTLKDSARVDSLEELSQTFGYYMVAGFVPVDSGYKYSRQANEEAKRLGYKKGIANSAISMARSEQLTIAREQQYRKYGFVAKEKLQPVEEKINQALTLAESIQDYKAIGSAYEALAEIFNKTKESEKAKEYYKKAITYYRMAGDIESERTVCAWLSTEYFSGKYAEAFEYCKRSVLLARKANPVNDFGDWLSLYAFYNMAELYKSIADYETALAYYREGAQYAKSHNSIWMMESEIGQLYYKMNRFDSSVYYLQRFIGPHPKTNWAKLCQGQVYLMTKEYDKAIETLKVLIDSFKKRNNWVGLFNTLLTTGSVYAEKKNYKLALAYAKDALFIAKKQDGSQWQLEGYHLLSKLFYQSRKSDSAYNYLNKYVTLKDSLQNIRFLWQISDFKSLIEDEKKESEIALLNKDNKLSQQQLKQEAQLKRFLIFGMIGLFVIGFFIFRTLVLKRKNDKLRLQKDLEMQQLASEKKHAELQQQALELEMQALRAQMNPHFIFNCLSSINRFIFKNDNKLASDYLTRFSRLIRMVLMHSQKKLIPLEDELEMLRLYLDLERLRFKDAFDYSITTTNIVDAGAIFIPPLLLQPFCENAVWHGLMHKEEKGHLNIIISEIISEQEKVLHCIIEDDGIGREKAAEMKSKSAENEKSMGLKITTERLALLNQENNFSTFYKIEDVLNEKNEVAGTRVQLKIRYKENIEETFDQNNITAENMSK